MLVSATDIKLWANRRDAQEMLPRLIRRLIRATVSPINRIGFPAGEGVQMGGWDGRLEVEQGNAFVPDGVSAWELGSSGNVKGKADVDYEKRTTDPLGINQSESTFVFVTSRRWKNKAQWAADRKKEGMWGDVRAFDADDLEEWMETAPAVHIWLSIHLGKHPHGMIDAESYWQSWAHATNPAISPELVLAGRQETLEYIHRWIDDPSQTLALKGETREEASSVFIAAIQKLDSARRATVLSRVVVVRDPDSWNQLVGTGERLILVQEFDSTEVVGRALQRGHTVVIPLGRADSDSTNAIDIPRLVTEEAAKALSAMGMPEEQVGKAAAFARRSLTTLRRQISHVPAVFQPAWARPKNGRALVPALLAGRWSDQSEGDRQAIGTLASGRYEDAREGFVRWTNEDDAPIRCVGAAWYLSSAEDAWALLGRYLTRDDLELFGELAIRVLGTSDPAFELPQDKRWAAGVLGKRPEYSSLLHSGVANTLAIMASRGESIQVTGGLSLPRVAARCVRQLLASNDWKLWASLPLPLLAEAAPTEFLAACERGLRAEGEESFLLALFQEEEDDPLFGSSPHVRLLFALETLAWSPEHLAQAALILAKLAGMYPGGRTANRPQASLNGLFLPWYPRTTASLKQRLRVLDLLRQKTPNIAWKTMCRSLPKSHDSALSSAQPNWREWAPEKDRRVSEPEYANALRELIARVLTDANLNGDRWADVVEALPNFPLQEYDETVRRLEALDQQMLLPADGNAIWQALRTVVSVHRSYSDADWTLPQARVDKLHDLLGRFKPRDPLSRFGWLFGSRPSLPEGREEDWQAHERAVIARQDEAVSALCQKDGLGWVAEFRQAVERPELLGAALARVDSDGRWETTLLANNLSFDDRSKWKLIAGFVGQKVRDHGVAWARKKLQQPGWDWTSEDQAVFCTCLPFNHESWDLVESLDQEAVHSYWEKVPAYYVDVESIERVVRRLLDHQRPSDAIDLLGIHARCSSLPGTLVADSLELLLRQWQEEPEVRRVLSQHIEFLLPIIAASADVDDGRVATLEWAFLPALRHHSYKPKCLHRELSRSPKFFAEIVRLVFRAKDEEEARKPSEQEKGRARLGYELLHSWRSLPGTDDEGTLDPVALRAWVLGAREILREDRRLAIGDNMIGKVFSGSPGGDDDAWPHRAVRDLIEELASDEFEQALANGLMNSEGIVCRDPSEGGERERRTADRYERYASIVGDRWIRTAAMLRSIRGVYLARARDEDQRAKLRDDLSP